MNSESFDVSSEPAWPRQADAGREADAERPFVGVQFECCGAYARIYMNRERTAYVGNCPRCAKQVRLRIGPGGTQQRFFKAQ